MTSAAHSSTALAPELREQVVRIIVRHLAPQHFRLYLFGSRARGTATARSDYDFALEAGQSLDLATLARLRADLDDLPILQRVELVDLNEASDDFRHRALDGALLIDER
jgi:predicted nucleotidyltransferase